MSEMVERVARAIFENGGADWERDASPNMRVIALSEARAAIEAMREATEAMAKAASDDVFGRVSPDHCAVTWAVMMRAALA